MRKMQADPEDRAAGEGARGRIGRIIERLDRGVDDLAGAGPDALLAVDHARDRHPATRRHGGRRRGSSARWPSRRTAFLSKSPPRCDCGRTDGPASLRMSCALSGSVGSDAIGWWSPTFCIDRERQVTPSPPQGEGLGEGGFARWGVNSHDLAPTPLPSPSPSGGGNQPTQYLEALGIIVLGSRRQSCSFVQRCQFRRSWSDMGPFAITPSLWQPRPPRPDPGSAPRRDWSRIRPPGPEAEVRLNVYGDRIVRVTTPSLGGRAAGAEPDGDRAAGPWRLHGARGGGARHPLDRAGLGRRRPRRRAVSLPRRGGPASADGERRRRASRR